MPIWRCHSELAYIKLNYFANLLWHCNGCIADYLLNLINKGSKLHISSYSSLTPEGESKLHSCSLDACSCVSLPSCSTHLNDLPVICPDEEHHPGSVPHRQHWSHVVLPVDDCLWLQSLQRQHKHIGDQIWFMESFYENPQQALNGHDGFYVPVGHRSHKVKGEVCQRRRRNCQELSWSVVTSCIF